MKKEEFLDKYLNHIAEIRGLIESYESENNLTKKDKVNILSIFLIMLSEIDNDIDEDDLIELFKLSMHQLDQVMNSYSQYYSH